MGLQGPAQCLEGTPELHGTHLAGHGGAEALGPGREGKGEERRRQQGSAPSHPSPCPEEYSPAWKKLLKAPRTLPSWTLASWRWATRNERPTAGSLRAGQGGVWELRQSCPVHSREVTMATVGEQKEP